jgi:hypothetical protein
MDFDFALFCKRRIRDDVRGSKGRRGRSTFLYAISSRRCTSATPPFWPSATPLPLGTIGLWARPIPPHQQPRKQYRTSFPKPPLCEAPQSPQPPRLAPGPTTTTSDGAACLAVTPPPPTAPAVPHPRRSTSTTDESQAWPALRMYSPPTFSSPKHHLYLRRLHRSSLPPTPPAAA